MELAARNLQHIGIPCRLHICTDVRVCGVATYGKFVLKCDCNWPSLIDATNNELVLYIHIYILYINMSNSSVFLYYIGTDGSISNIAGNVYNELHIYVCVPNISYSPATCSVRSWNAKAHHLCIHTMPSSVTLGHAMPLAFQCVCVMRMHSHLSIHPMEWGGGVHLLCMVM